MKRNYLYLGSMRDMLDPTMLKGWPIEPGTPVSVSRKLRPRMLPPCFAVIVDKAGNVQTVWKASLRRIK
jgi:hypothetical protein